MTKKICFRVDGGSEIGTGHIFRCLTLAKLLIGKEFSVIFIVRHLPESLEKILIDHNILVKRLPRRQSNESEGQNIYSQWLGVSQKQDASDTIAAIEQLGGASAIIIDHYGIDASWQNYLRNFVELVCVIDDLANRKHAADILIDTNYYAGYIERYDHLVPTNCLKLLGPKYALLRDEFSALKKPAHGKTQPIKTVLLSLGGVDQPNYTSSVLNSLQKIAPFEHVDVVIGATHPYKSEIENFCAGRAYQLHIQANNMGELMRAANLSIGAGGTTTWERMCIGLAGLTLCVADNQKLMLNDAHKAGLIFAPNIKPDDVEEVASAIEYLRERPNLLHDLARKGLETVDGFGASRVASSIKEKL